LGAAPHNCTLVAAGRTGHWKGIIRGLNQWCIAKNGCGYTQWGVAKGLKVPCLFMITEVSIRCQKNPGGWYTPYTRVYPQYTTGLNPGAVMSISHGNETKPVVTSFRWDWGDWKRSERAFARMLRLVSHLCISCRWDTIRHDTRCYINVRSKANMSQLNLPHGADN